jgi:hypothetical protein
MGSGKEPGPTYQEHGLGQVALAYAPCMGVIQCTERSLSIYMPMQCTRRAAHHQGCWAYTPSTFVGSGYHARAQYVWVQVMRPNPLSPLMGLGTLLEPNTC